MESQPENPEFRNNAENFHPCIWTQPRWYQTVLLQVKYLWSYLNSPDDTKQWSSPSKTSGHIWTYQVIPNSDPPSQALLIISEQPKSYKTVILPLKLIISEQPKWSPGQTPLITLEQTRRYQTVILPVKYLWSHLKSPDDTEKWSSQSNPSDHIWTYQVIPNSDPPSQTPLIISEQPRWYQTVILPFEQPKWYQTMILPVKPLRLYLISLGDT